VMGDVMTDGDGRQYLSYKGISNEIVLMAKVAGEMTPPDR
jgi:hypothetical protein